MGVNQGCPMLQSLFGLYFDQVVTSIHNNIAVEDLVLVAWLSIAAALYADSITLLALHPASLQAYMTALASFATPKALRISSPKSFTLFEHCSGTIKLPDG